MRFLEHSRRERSQRGRLGRGRGGGGEESSESSKGRRQDGKIRHREASLSRYADVIFRFVKRLSLGKRAMAIGGHATASSAEDCWPPATAVCMQFPRCGIKTCQCRMQLTI